MSPEKRLSRPDGRITDSAALLRVKNATDRVPHFVEVPIVETKRFTIRALPCAYYGDVATALCYRDFGDGVEDVLVSVRGASMGFRMVELEPVG